MTAHDVQDVTAKRIPEEVLPNNMPHAAKRVCINGSRPDMILFRPRDRTIPAKYTVVEVKYCRDTDTASQGERAASQHAALASAIRRADRTAHVEYLTVLLGVSGSIYTDCTLQPLQALGVSGRHLRKLKFKLHCIAVQQLRWIYCHKQKQERALSGTPCFTGTSGSKKRPRNQEHRGPAAYKSRKRHKS